MNFAKITLMDNRNQGCLSHYYRNLSHFVPIISSLKVKIQSCLKSFPKKPFEDNLDNFSQF